MILNYPQTPIAEFFGADISQWNNWTWQLQNALTTQDEFEKVFSLYNEERLGFSLTSSLFKVSATPYYLSLALQQEKTALGHSSQSKQSQIRQPGPLRKIMVPTATEAVAGAQQMLDPLDEHNHSPVARIVHRYSDRVLFLATDTCSVYCRFCTRKRFTGQKQGIIGSQDYNAALDYIRAHPGIREVIFSGGDPLTLSNNVLRRLLSDVRAIPHVEIIRVGSRMPVVCPMRVDEELCRILKDHGPVYLMNHFSHPKELSAEAKTALTLLADHGIPLMNQMVLLNGVNNDAAVIQALNRRLLYLRVKPYYMFQCDPSQGTDHLRTTVESSEAIVRELWGHLSGLAMAALSLDIPGGGGKATLVPNFMTAQGDGVREYQGWDGKKGLYRNPEVEVLKPSDAQDYAAEWQALKEAKQSSHPFKAGELHHEFFQGIIRK